jgi:RHS repeat-associated protein
VVGNPATIDAVRNIAVSEDTALRSELCLHLLDRLTNISWTGSTGNVLRSFAYAYNTAGMITNIALETGANLSYSYDDLDRLTGETSAGSATSAVGYAYDEVGNRTQKTKDGVTVTYAYQSGCNRLTGWTAVSTDDFVSLRRVDVSGHSSEPIGTNPALGQLWISNSVATVVPTVSGTNFSTASFLVGFGSQQIVTAIGDVAGNVGYATNSVVVAVVTNGEYSFNTAGCVTSIVYRSGDVTETLALTWNDRYELTAVATNGVEAERHGYDAFGGRVWSWDGTETNWFVYDGVQVVADLNSTGGLIRSYVWGPGIDNLLATTVRTGATAKTYFALTDHLGTVHALSDSSGAIVESYRFDAWGRVLEVRDQSGNLSCEADGSWRSGIGNRYLWQGREYSWRTGLYYFRARWYDPITGRWLSNDPIGISGGLNQYVFCANNPVNFVDPRGQEVYEVRPGLYYDTSSGETFWSSDPAACYKWIQSKRFWGLGAFFLMLGILSEYNDECPAGRTFDDIMGSDDLFKQWLGHKHPKDQPLSPLESQKVWDRLKEKGKNPTWQPGHPGREWDVPHIHPPNGGHIPTDPSWRPNDG